jgi:hypothetical protein
MSAEHEATVICATLLGEAHGCLRETCDLLELFPEHCGLTAELRSAEFRLKLAAGAMRGLSSRSAVRELATCDHHRV